ncbi:EAL and HDOD domain-containing protein [Thiomicrorhabdus sp. Kp2]|uniref:EAL and HDOD domain-containing protein n=1 Tax=Thiomicrorhabdus sp. Kp2 TaxID=1123518 RepID=UPI0004057DF1|nr:EAL domain-containing protein [Thiomicrorhabdus sp. Kp2]
MSEVFIGRQPILDRDMNVFAYELQFHQGINPNNKTLQATAELIKEIEDNIGFQSIVGNHNVLLNLPKELLKKTALPQFDTHYQLVLEIPNNITKDVDVLRHLKELKADGASIALDDFIDDESSIRLASISDYVKIDPESHSEVQIRKMLADLQDKNIKVIAEKVETEEMFLYLKKLGFDYFQGYFFTNPLIINGQKLSGNKLTLLQLLAKVNDSNTDFAELSDIISQDVALSHKLLVAINNPAAMIPIRVESVADAVKYMGIKRLKFWVNMLMLSSMEDVPQELLTTSLMRAKFCELLAEASGYSSDKDSFFLVGLFSNLGAFFKTPIDKIVAQMPLAEDLVEALVDNEGPMGEALKVLVSIERVNSTLESLHYDGLSINQVGKSFMAANAWAQQVIAD